MMYIDKPMNRNQSLNSHDSEDEESSPIDILPENTQQTPQKSEYSSIDNQPESASSRNTTSNSYSGNEAEGDVTGSVEQWVIQPAKQGVVMVRSHALSSSSSLC